MAVSRERKRSGRSSARTHRMMLDGISKTTMPAQSSDVPMLAWSRVRSTSLRMVLDSATPMLPAAGGRGSEL